MQWVAFEYNDLCDCNFAMAQDDILKGWLICEIGIGEVWPAKFIIF
jgi:phage tail sheath protein FI